MAGAVACSFELAISGTVPLGTVLPAMLGVHALIGIGEARDHRRRRQRGPGHPAGPRPRPLAVPHEAASRSSRWRWPIGLATAVSPFASSAPDGLNRVAADQGFAARGRRQDAPVAGYAFPGVDDERLATGLAGFAGTLVVFARRLRRRRRARRRRA